MTAGQQPASCVWEPFWGDHPMISPFPRGSTNSSIRILYFYVSLRLHTEHPYVTQAVNWPPTPSIGLNIPVQKKCCSTGNFTSTPITPSPAVLAPLIRPSFPAITCSLCIMTVLSTVPSTLSSSPSSQTVTGSMDDSSEELVWQVPVFLVVVLVIIAIIAGIILLIWNDHWVASARGWIIMTFIGPESPFLLFPASALIRPMLRYFLTTSLPAFRNLNLRQADAVTSLGSAIPRSHPLLPLVMPTGFRGA
ncbi:hypothetical protein F5148DRAFT_1230944 [Russula earlei]|uniref:Uncharacterized protein n=1 Tax=Russula earlei TaxID=71964 RepID=A0ACC0U0L8_9AGAM|nr:hypothetical protein F5148DRAFT_1230944 [Russula earlei]